MTKSLSIQQLLLNQIQIPTKLLTSYKSLGMNEKEVMVVLQLHRFLLENNDFPTPADLSSYLTVNEKECANILRRLIQKDLLTIEQTENNQNQLSEAYCLNPLWEKLFNEKKIEKENLDGTIFILFEQEFGRPLSPFEIETINSWLDADKIAPSLIKAGLRESVLMGKLNFKYIDRILRDWQKKGIHSVEQAREESKSFRDKQVMKPNNNAKRDTSFYYNWLESEE
ncbi:DnaD domain-containing protein [Virgibacillus alimentarius]|uniref:DNA replication protein n=1 Tax=Virgibacillus alimentarius TaxID=698769 RepID=A0ABS4S5K8_9BACI|nr:MULTISPECIES: DnaD domain-containing protein [Virgibacillus]MBP2256351.1 DNA replication protein [Virgibacillus alimentarius]HLR66296.1 DnaD domain-containing protein [Virgibacillus sp.]